PVPRANLALQFGSAIALMYGALDLRRQMPPYYCPDETHQTVGLAHFSSPDRFGYGEKRVVNGVIKILPAELAPDEETHTTRKDVIQVLHSFGVIGLNSRNNEGPCGLSLGVDSCARSTQDRVVLLDHLYCGPGPKRLAAPKLTQSAAVVNIERIGYLG